ncbi:hypothetical protein [Actinomadura sp. 6N118]|uniref:hypothetical protein n=1 Tax=Actinomadura sp. 6N118 TaxID=3375151 RepID=UPI003797052B
MSIIGELPTVSAEQVIVVGEAKPEEDVLQLAAKAANVQIERLAPGVEKYLEFLRTGSDAPEESAAGTTEAAAVARIGDAVSPICPLYVPFDVVAIGPIQTFGSPPGQAIPPHKVIGHTENALILAVVFVNPLSSAACGYFMPPTTQLSGRDFRVRLEQVNLSTVANGPDDTFTGTFTGLPLTLAPFLISGADPGPNPNLFEANITVDIDDPQQPFAAFATNVLDLDNDPAFAGIPAQPAGFKHRIPIRYLVYRK